MNQPFLPIVAAIMVTIVSCSSNKPPDLIPRDQFIEIFVNLELDRAFYRATQDSIRADSIRQVILNKYQITEAQFIRSRDYYQQTGQEGDILKSALDKLKNDRDKVNTFIREQTDTTKADTAKTGAAEKATVNGVRKTNPETPVNR